MGRHLLGFQLFRPLGFLEADQHEVIARQQRALDQQVLALGVTDKSYDLTLLIAFM